MIYLFVHKRIPTQAFYRFTAMAVIATFLRGLEMTSQIASLMMSFPVVNMFRKTTKVILH